MKSVIRLKTLILFASLVMALAVITGNASAASLVVTYSPTTVLPTYSGNISVTGAFDFEGPRSMPLTATNTVTNTVYNFTTTATSPTSFSLPYNNSLPAGIYTLVINVTGNSFNYTGLLALTPNFEVGNPPSISSVSPSSANVGDPNTTIAVTGTYFQSGAVVQWNGTALTTTYSDSTDLSATIPHADFATAGSDTITVLNPDGGVSSGSLFSVNNPSPTTSSMSPTSILAGSSGFTLTVNGGNFVNGSAVDWNGSALTTTSVNASQITVVVPAGDVASTGSASVTVVNAAPGGGTSTPALTFTITGNPVISSVSPSSATAGDPDTSIAVTGSGFESGAVVQWNGTALSTTFTDASDLTATVPAADLASAGTGSITVLNPDTGLSSGATFTVNNLLPTTTSMSPNAALIGSSGLTITVTGLQFVSGATVDWNGLPLATTYVSSTELTATVPSSDLTSAGTASVTVANPAPGGGSSTPALTFTINAVPTVTSVVPDTVLAGDPDTLITVTGTGFESGAVVYWNTTTALTTTFVDAQTLTATVPASYITTAGTNTVTVTNPDTGFSVSGATVTVDNLTPLTTSVSPSSILYGSSDFTVTITGHNFVSGSTVNWNGTPLTTTYVSATSLTATVPASDVASAGSASVTVTNPAPGGGISNPALTFTITANPAIASLSPSSTTVINATLSVDVTGTGFENGAVIEWNGTPLTTTYTDSSDLSTILPISDVDTAGTFTITVVNPDTGLSSGATFTVNNPVPTASSVSPSSVLFGAPTTVVTVTGTSFVSGSTVNWNGSPVPTTFVNSTTLTASIQLGFLASPSSDSITVTNPTPGGGTSTPALVFTVTDIPTITSVTPNSATVGDPDTIIDVVGTGFEVGAEAQWNGVGLVTSVLSSTELTATIPAADLTGQGAFSITVLNPDLGQSVGSTFTVNSPVPLPTSISPSSILAGSAGFTITVTGTGFISASVIVWNGSPLTTTYVSSTTLTATVASSLVASGGIDSVSVSSPSPGGGLSAGLPFTVTSAPSITSLAANHAVYHAPQTTITITGTGFESGARATFDGMHISATYVSATSMTAVIPAQYLLNSGIATVAVINPDGGTSNGASFTVGIAPPAAFALSPNSAPYHSAPVTVAITGSGFQAGTRAQYDGMRLVVTYVSPTSLTAVIPAEYMYNSGIAVITLINPDGQVSNTSHFTVGNAPPAIKSISPNHAVKNGAQASVTITGTGFRSGCTATYSGLHLPVTYVNSTTLTTVIPSQYFANTGTAAIVVTNPDSQHSNAGSFMVTASGS